MPKLTAKQCESISSLNKIFNFKFLFLLAQSSSSSNNTVSIGLYECYNFLTNNEYSDKTIGLFAFILRKSVGDINFSYIINEIEKRNQPWY